MKRAEGTIGVTSLTRANAERIVQALEAAGVEFIAGVGRGPGTRLVSTPR